MVSCRKTGLEVNWVEIEEACAAFLSPLYLKEDSGKKVEKEEQCAMLKAEGLGACSVRVC